MEEGQAQHTHEKDGRWNGQCNEEHFPVGRVHFGCHSRIIREPYVDTEENRNAEANDGEEEATEVDIVPLADAVVDKRTVMVVSQNTIVAIAAMFRPGWLQHLAKGAPPEASGL